MSRAHRLPLLGTLALGIVVGFMVDRLLDVSTPTAEAQTRTSLQSLQAEIAALQAALQNINAAQITTGTLASARLPANIDAATLGGRGPTDYMTQSDASSIFLRLDGGHITGSLSIDGNFACGGDALVVGDIDADKVLCSRVGIGTTSPSAPLTCTGGIQVGLSSQSANSSTAGMIRWNPGMSRLEFSDGASWRGISSAP